MRDALSERDWQYPFGDVAASRNRVGSAMDDKTGLPLLTQWTISPVPRPSLVTVVETPEFLAATRKLMEAGERALLVDYLALNPIAGDLIPGTGGVRKLRWGLEGRGKRGGARVIYFYHNPGIRCSR
jgi:hypothetical protein